MAVSTYLQLVNKVLRQKNEVELTSSNFATALGVYASVRDGVQFAINKINTYHQKWRFNFQEDQSQVLVAGQELYSLPSDYKVIDWDSFYIVKNDSLGVTTKKLEWIDRKIYNRYYKEKDYDQGATGRGVPDYVFGWYNTKFGVTPSPDDTYTVKYNYWNLPTQLSAHGDSTNIPSDWDHVIVLGAMWYGSMFKEDLETVDRLKNEFETALKHMRSVLVNEDRDFTDTVVNAGQRAYTHYQSTATGYELS